MKQLIIFALVILSSGRILAQSPQEQQVAKAVETLVTGILDGDSSALVSVTDDALVYGHSSGKMETKQEFVSSLASGRSDFKTLNVSDQTIVIKGNTAVVRHKVKGDAVDNGKEAAVNLGVLMVWVKDKGKWKLIARQGFKL